MKKILIFVAGSIVIALTLFFHFATNSSTDFFSRIKPYRSHLDKTLEYIEANYPDAEARRLLKAYAIEFDKILKNPRLSSEQLDLSLEMKDKKTTLVFCLFDFFNSEEETDQIQNMLIGTKDNILRYHAYESHFFGKTIKYNKSYNYEKSCKDF